MTLQADMSLVWILGQDKQSLEYIRRSHVPVLDPSDL